MSNTVKNTAKNIFHSFGLLKAIRSVIYWSTQFDPNTTNPRRVMVRFYSQFIHKGDLCFDVGANIGQRTDIFLEIGAKVICIEPQSICLKKLHYLFGNNQDVVIVPKGVGDKEGFAELLICHELSSISTMSKNWTRNSIHAKEYGYEWSNVEKVPVTTLDALIAQYGIPAFCKIDVEGFEELVLKGLTEPIPFISFEFNAGFFDAMERCINRLSEIGSYQFNFAIAEPSGGRGLVLPEWVKPNEICKELYALNAVDSKIWGDIYARLR